MKKASLDSINQHPDSEVVVFTEAVKVAPHERGPFLQRRCGGNENLVQKLEALLRAHDRLGNFLEEPLTERPG